jgi:hypothetical protein
LFKDLAVLRERLLLVLRIVLNEENSTDSTASPHGNCYLLVWWKRRRRSGQQTAVQQSGHVRVCLFAHTQRLPDPRVQYSNSALLDEVSWVDQN